MTDRCAEERRLHAHTFHAPSDSRQRRETRTHRTVVGASVLAESLSADLMMTVSRPSDTTTPHPQCHFAHSTYESSQGRRPPRGTPQAGARGCPPVAAARPWHRTRPGVRATPPARAA